MEIFKKENQEMNILYFLYFFYKCKLACRSNFLSCKKATLLWKMLKKKTKKINIYMVYINTKYKYFPLHMRNLTCSLTLLSLKQKKKENRKYIQYI